MKLKKEQALSIIMNALKEDIGAGDITSSLVFEKDVNITADITAKRKCLVCGIDIARWIFNALDEKIIFRPLCKDGDKVREGKKIISLKGSVRNILAGERVALNFLGRLSGIATLTSVFVKRIKGTKARIFDTRKTTPGLRQFEKYAVSVGGGSSHRMGLWDEVLIKDSHLESLRFMDLEDVVKKVKSKGYKDVEIEVGSLKEFKSALDAGADIIMLDNMKIEDIRKVVKLRGARGKGQEKMPILEVSGGVNLENVSRIAKIGIDRISIGFLTHSAQSIDFSLEI